MLLWVGAGVHRYEILSLMSLCKAEHSFYIVHCSKSALCIGYRTTAYGHPALANSASMQSRTYISAPFYHSGSQWPRMMESILR